MTTSVFLGSIVAVPSPVALDVSTLEISIRRHRYRVVISSQHAMPIRRRSGGVVIAADLEPDQEFVPCTHSHWYLSVLSSINKRRLAMSAAIASTATVYGIAALLLPLRWVARYTARLSFLITAVRELAMLIALVRPTRPNRSSSSPQSHPVILGGIADTVDL